MEQLSYSVEELARAVDLPVRTIRYYIAEGLVPGPFSRGRGARYGSEHVARLQRVRGLAAQQLPLARIRERLERPEAAVPAVSPRAYLEGLLAAIPRRPAAEPPPEAETWRHYTLRPGFQVALRADQESVYTPLLAKIQKMLCD